MNDVILKVGKVLSITDDAKGNRIKAQTSEDKSGKSKIPYAFPLLPKTFQSIPKVGEYVLIITSKIGNEYSNRYYIGPILSQPQYYEYENGESAKSLLKGSKVEPLRTIDTHNDTVGSFPDTEDVALVGRKGEDVILKEGEIDIRCGIRKNGHTTDPNLKGNVFFNNTDPSYIQLKYMDGDKTIDGSKSIANIVADQINVISHKNLDLSQYNTSDNKAMIANDELVKIRKTLKSSVYGEELVDVLSKMIDAILLHVHPYPGMRPCETQLIEDVCAIDLTKILSSNFKIS